MANVYVDGGNGSTTGWWGITKWSAGMAMSTSVNGGRGTYIRQLTTPTIGQERVFRCISAGTGGVSGSTEPTWTVTHHGNTSDHLGTWTECTGDEVDMGSGGTWTAPHARIGNAMASGWSAAGDVIYVRSSHTETQSAAQSFNAQGTPSAPTPVICVNGTTVPPASGEGTTGATVTGTGSTQMSLGGCVYWDGFTFSTSSSAASAIRAFNGNATGDYFRFKNCTFTTTSTSNPPFEFFSSNAPTPQGFWFENCTFNFNNQTVGIGLGGSKFIFRGCTMAGTMTSINRLFDTSADTLADMIDLMIESCDFSAMATTTALIAGGSSNGYIGDIVLNGCKLVASGTIAATPTSPACTIDMWRCDSGTKTYRNERYMYQGTMTTVTDAIRTGGSTDGTTAFSYNLATTANNQWVNPFEFAPWPTWNTNVASTVTVTWYGVYNGAALPNNNEIWGTVSYFGVSGNPLQTINEATTATYVATPTALSADTSAWDTALTARANSTGYSVGARISVSTAPGQIFFCTTAGTSSSSLPSGYATCADGSSVTDGSGSPAIFRAGVRFKQAITLSSPHPQLAGYIGLVIKAAKASVTYVVDPQAYLS